MIGFVALSFTALCRELSQGRKAPAHLEHGFFVFNCHRQHIFGTPDMEDDKPCSELVDMASRYMVLSEDDTVKYIQEVQDMLQVAEDEGRLYCMNGLNVANPKQMKRLLVLGCLVDFGIHFEPLNTDWLNSKDGLASWVASTGVEVIR